jgi:hypothetical protein
LPSAPENPMALVLLACNCATIFIDLACINHHYNFKHGCISN